MSEFPSLLQSAEDARHGRVQNVRRPVALERAIEQTKREMLMSARERFEASVTHEIRRLIHEATLRYERELEQEGREP